MCEMSDGSHKRRMAFHPRRSLPPACILKKLIHSLPPPYPYPFYTPHPLPQRTNSRRLPLPGAPTPVDSAALSHTSVRSMEHERDPLASDEIHDGGATVLQGSGRHFPTPARRPLSP
jgi:hypothetical protein